MTTLLAHALVAREDLPIPDWLFAWGASLVLIASFAGLSLLWREPRLEKDEWRPVVSSVFYRLRQPNGEVTSEPVAVAASSQRYWQLRVDPKSGGLGREPPSLRVEWRPRQIVFAARGNPPFTLAYGSGVAQPVALPVATLVPGYDTTKGLPANVGTAAVGPALKAGDAAALRAPVDVKRIVLWSTLVIAALVLGAMAWRLAKQMGSGSRPAGDTGEPPH